MNKKQRKLVKAAKHDIGMAGISAIMLITFTISAVDSLNKALEKE